MVHLINKTRSLYQILDKNGKRSVIQLLIISLFAGILESIAFSSISPVVSEYSSTTINYLANNNSIPNSIFILIIAFIFRSVFLIALSYYQAISIFKIQAFISKSLLQKYLVKRSRSKNVNLQAKNIIVEAQNITQHAYVPMLTLASDMIIILLLSTYLISLNGINLLYYLIMFSVVLLSFSHIVKKYLYTLGDDRKQLDGKRYQYVNEALEQKDLIFSHSLYAYFNDRYSKVNAASAIKGSLQLGLNASTRWIIELLIVVFIVIYIIITPVDNIPQIEQIIVSLSLSMRLLPLSSKILSNIQKLNYSGSVLEELSEDLNFINEPCLTTLLSNCKKNKQTSLIEFRDVVLKVSESKGVYFEKYINIKLKTGRVYSLTGGNGIGKSTFVKAILGSIESNLISGGVVITATTHEIIETDDINYLNSMVSLAYVPQDPVFIDTSIRENLTFDCEYDYDEIVRVLKLVGLWEYIQSLPDEIDTLMGDKYGRFSGGQRQRLSIARALIRGSNLIILDEPTSATDGNFDKELISIIREVSSYSIVIIITHSRDLATMCDKQLIMTEKELLQA